MHLFEQLPNNLSELSNSSFSQVLPHEGKVKYKKSLVSHGTVTMC